MSEQNSPEQSQRLAAELQAKKEGRTLSAEMEAMRDEHEKLIFMAAKRAEFRNRFVEAGGDYRAATNVESAEGDPTTLHYWYHQYCGSNAGFYPDVSRNWRASVETKAKKYGLDKIPLTDSWVTFGADMEEPPNDNQDISVTHELTEELG